MSGRSISIMEWRSALW
jgi:outer membrane murein-binding lipoprotein Lpp